MKTKKQTLAEIRQWQSGERSPNHPLVCRLLHAKPPTLRAFAALASIKGHGREPKHRLPLPSSLLPPPL